MLAGWVPKPKRMPDRDEQAVLDELQVNLVAAGQKTRWNQLVRQHHYLKSSNLVGGGTAPLGWKRRAYSVSKPDNRSKRGVRLFATELGQGFLEVSPRLPPTVAADLFDGQKVPCEGNLIFLGLTLFRRGAFLN